MAYTVEPMCSKLLKPLWISYIKIRNFGVLQNLHYIEKMIELFPFCRIKTKQNLEANFRPVRCLSQ